MPSTTFHATKVRLRFAHSIASSKRRLPAAKLREFLYSLAKGEKSLSVQITSPSITKLAGTFSLLGTPLITRALCVTSSPMIPLPRVSARIKRPAA